MADYGRTSSTSSEVPTDETDRLIASNKVEGTPVYNRQGESLGEVYNFMVDKYSGKVAYAVMSFGGFSVLERAIIRCLGKPWTMTQAWVDSWWILIGLSLRGHLGTGRDEDPWATDREYGRNVYDYYGYHYE